MPPKADMFNMSPFPDQQRAQRLRNQEKAKKEAQKLAQEEASRRATEAAMADERQAVTDIYGQMIGQTGSTDQFLTDVVDGKIVPVGDAERNAMIAAAQDPIAAELEAGQSYLRNLYGGRGFGAGGGGETESIRQLRMAGLQEGARGAQSAIIAAANQNLNARLTAANQVAQNAAIKAGVASQLGNFLTQYPITDPKKSFGNIDVPMNVQPSQNAVQF